MPRPHPPNPYANVSGNHHCYCNRQREPLSPDEVFDLSPPSIARQEMPCAHSFDLSMPLATDMRLGLPRLVPVPTVVAAADNYHIHIPGSSAADLGHAGPTDCWHQRVAVGRSVRHPCSGFGLHSHLYHHRRYCRNTYHRQRNRHVHPLVLLPKTLGDVYRFLVVSVVLLARQSQSAHLVSLFFAGPTPTAMLVETVLLRLLLLLLPLLSRRRSPQRQATTVCCQLSVLALAVAPTLPTMAVPLPTTLLASS